MSARMLISRNFKEGDCFDPGGVPFSRSGVILLRGGVWDRGDTSGLRLPCRYAGVNDEALLAFAGDETGPTAAALPANPPGLGGATGDGDDPGDWDKWKGAVAKLCTL